MFTFSAPCKRKLNTFLLLFVCAVWLHLALSTLILAKYVIKLQTYLGAIYVRTSRTCRAIIVIIIITSMSWRTVTSLVELLIALFALCGIAGAL
jgi:hypothetical protein